MKIGLENINLTRLFGLTVVGSTNEECKGFDNGFAIGCEAEENVAEAMVYDALMEKKSGVIFLHGAGTDETGRVESAFGRVAVASTVGRQVDRKSRYVSDGNQEIKRSPNTSNENNDKNSSLIEVKEKMGMLGMLVSLLFKHGFGDMGKAWFTLSILEIVEDDVLRDSLKSTTLSSSSHRTKKSGGSSTSYDKMYSKKTSPINESRMKNKINNTLKIRHPDAKGAIVQNLVEVTPVSLEACEELIKTAFHSFHDNVKHVGQEESGSGGGRSGHILATLKIHHLS